MQSVQRVVLLFAGCSFLVACKQSNSDAPPPVAGASAPVSVASAPPSPPPVVQLKKGPWAGPFGVAKGITREDLESAIELKAVPETANYASKTAPVPHSSFDQYNYSISPDSGLCRVSAASVDINTGDFGSELKSEFVRFKDMLSEKYGKPSSSYDFLRSGSLWTDGRYWMMGLLKKDRVLASFWEAKIDKATGASTLPNNLKGFAIEGRAIGPNVGYVSITYEFDNIEDCQKANKKESSKAL